MNAMTELDKAEGGLLFIYIAQDNQNIVDSNKLLAYGVFFSFSPD